jgi:hypothetical protein
LLLTLAALVVIGLAEAVVLWPRPDRITAENFDRLRVGMTPAEVRAFLGSPGDYKTRDRLRAIAGPRIGDKPVWFDDSVQSQRWETDAARIDVIYSRAGTVKAAMYYDHVVVYDPFGPRASSPESLVQRAKRRWHRWFP